MSRLCCEDGCDEIHYAKGLCKKHYMSSPQIKQQQKEYRASLKGKEHGPNVDIHRTAAAAGAAARACACATAGTRASPVVAHARRAHHTPLTRPAPTAPAACGGFYLQNGAKI